MSEGNYFDANSLLTYEKERQTWPLGLYCEFNFIAPIANNSDFNNSKKMSGYSGINPSNAFSIALETLNK